MQRLLKKCIILILPLLVLVSSCTTNKPNQWKEAYWEYFWEKNSMDTPKTEPSNKIVVRPTVKFVDMNYDGVPEMFLGYKVFTCIEGKVQQFSGPRFMSETNDCIIYENKDKNMRCILSECEGSISASLYRYDFDFKTLRILESEWREIHYYKPTQEYSAVFISSDGKKQHISIEDFKKEEKSRRKNWRNLNIKHNYYNCETKEQAKQWFYALMNDAV